MLNKVRAMLDEGVIGDVRAISAWFGYRVDDGMNHIRNCDPKLGGGGLLDVGVYPLHFCEMMLGKLPVELTGSAAFNTDANRYGVDEQAFVTAKYDDGALASMGFAIQTTLPERAGIYGTKGSIEIPDFCLKGYECEENLIRLDRCGELAAKKGLKVPQIAMAFVYNSAQFNLFALLGARGKQEMLEGIQTSEVSLTKAKMDYLDLKSERL